MESENPEYRFSNIRNTGILETNKSWHNLVYFLTKYINGILAHETDNGILELEQIKEKLGGLRFYTTFKGKNFELASYEIDRLDEVINFVEYLSFFMCQECEKPAKTDTTKSGWEITLCDDCKQEYYKNRGLI